MNWRSPINLFIVFTILCGLTTIFLRVPLPSKGYFNFGDVAVVFSGLVCGRFAERYRFLGGLAGGVGSAIADVVGGYALFAPITLVAKTLEGVCAVGASKGGALMWVLLPVGGAAMLGTYFVGEYFYPSMGFAAAFAELLPNLVQAGGGAIGGLILFRAFTLITHAGEI